MNSDFIYKRLTRFLPPSLYVYHLLPSRDVKSTNVFTHSFASLLPYPCVATAVTVWVQSKSICSHGDGSFICDLQP